MDAIERATWPQPRLRPSAAARSLARPAARGRWCPDALRTGQTRGTVRPNRRISGRSSVPGRAATSRTSGAQNAALRFAFRLRHSPASPVALARDPRPVTTRPIDPLHLRHEYGSCPMMFHDNRRTARRAAGDQGRARKALAQAAAMEDASIEKALNRSNSTGRRRREKRRRFWRPWPYRFCHLVRRPRVRAAVARPP